MQVRQAPATVGLGNNSRELRMGLSVCRIAERVKRLRERFLKPLANGIRAYSHTKPTFVGWAPVGVGRLCAVVAAILIASAQAQIF